MVEGFPYYDTGCLALLERARYYGRVVYSKLAQDLHEEQLGAVLVARAAGSTRSHPEPGS